MQKTKLKISISFILLVLMYLLTNQIVFLINYVMALIFHELGHLYVAKQKGYTASSMKLNLLGASIKIHNKINKDDLFIIALAGPITNFIICIICTSLWWLIPETYVFTSEFFRCNLLLASFNMLPVEPLDGAKILDSIISKHSKPTAKIISFILNVIVIVIFASLFIYSCFNQINFTFFIFALFFASNFSKRKINFDIYYNLFFKKNKPIEKINFLHIQPTCTLLSLLKQTREGYFTIFYCEINQPTYITEHELQDLITKNSLNSTIKEVIEKQH